MAALVPMLLQRQEAAREAALEAIAALCAFNQASQGPGVALAAAVSAVAAAVDSPQ